MPIITLLTDFGSQDYFVAAMKGTILSINPDAVIVDITHEIPPQDIEAAAFNLFAVYRDFPAGTIHLAVVDPGVGSSRRAIAVQCGEQFFVGPDNGVFSWIYEREQACRAVQIANEKFFRQPLSQTFHGRDIFAPVAAALANGSPLEVFGPVLDDLFRLGSLQPSTRDDGSTEARILQIDRFGNCITNLTREHLTFREGVMAPLLLINDHEISAFREFFADGSADGEVFCLFGSAGFLEIAARNSSAARILGAQRGTLVVVSGARAPDPN
jgi:S-adenosylmethionine hydrolase